MPTEDFVMIKEWVIGFACPLPVGSSGGCSGISPLPFCRADADGDQGEHIQIPRHQRTPAALEERPSRPQHDGCGENKLNPARRIAHYPTIVTQRGNQVRHSKQEDGQGKRTTGSRAAVSCLEVRCSPSRPCPQSLFSTPAPCHTWGNPRDDPAALRGASGRCERVCPLQVQPMPDYAPMPFRKLDLLPYQYRVR